MTTKAFRSRAILHCLTLFCFASIVFSYSLVGNVLQDLTSTDGNFFTEAAAWTASHLFSSDTLIAYPCNNTILLGGFDVLGSTVANGSQYGEYFQRNYTDLPSHNAITFKLGFWVLDSWEGSNGDTFQIAFDSTILDGWAFTSQDAVTPNTCGVTNAFDVPNVTIEGTVPHTGDSLVFQVISKLNQDSGDESFGFRDIKFTFINTTPAPTTSTICARAPTVLPDSRKCSCANANEFEYPVGSGTCITCDSTCATCSGSASNQCLTCPDGLYKSGTSCLPCDNSCLTCNGAGTQACQSCKPGTYLNGVQCSSCNSNCATCISGTSSSCTTCPAGRYLNGHQCPQCQSSCKTCSGSLTNQCLTCPTNSYMINNNTCIPTCSSPLYTTTDGINVFCESPCSSSEYAYWDGTCSTSCDSPLSQSVIGSYQLCTYDCAYNEYLYWNQTCKSTCPFPLQVQEFKTKSLCIYKCSLSQYLFWNGTCADSCPFPLKTRVESGRQYCDYPCTSSQYLRWDQTCVSSCPLPLQIQIVDDVRYCNFPCSSTQYAYWDGNCSSTACSSPLTLRTEGSGNYQRKFCDLDCGANEYMHWLSMCVSSCDAPLITSTYNGNPTCNPPCTTLYPYYFTDLNTCGKNCVSPRSINSTGLYLVCDPAPEADEGGSLLFYMTNAPVTPHEYTVVVTGNTLDYIHYLDMPMPERFEKLANSSGKSFLSPRFGLSEPQDFTSRRMLTTFVNYPLPEVFERSGLQSSFIINYWDAMTTLAVLLAIALGLTIIERILRITQLKTLHGIVERLQVMATGNYFLLILISSIQEIILYTALEVRSFSYDFLSTSSSIANFGVTIVMLILVTAAIAVMIFAAKKAYDADAYDFNEKSSQDYIDFAIKWRSIQVLFRGFKSDNILSRLFYLLYIIRLSIPTLIAACIIDYPLIQAIVQVVVNTAMLVYIILKRPFKRKANLVQLVIFEGVTLLLNIFVLIIVVVATNDLDPEFKVVTVLGDVVIVGASILTLLRLVFLIIKGKLEADSILKIRKQYPQKGLAVWVGLLSVLAQQTGYGFEEIFEEKCIGDTGNKYMGIFARSAAKEKVNSTRSNKIYPDTPNDLEPILLQNNSSLPKLAGLRAETPLGTSMVMANIETKTQLESPTNLKSRVKNLMNNLKLKKEDEQKDPRPDFPPLDVSDNSPDYDHGGTLLLTKSSSIDKLSPQIRARGAGFFNEEINIGKTNKEIEDDEGVKVLNLFPIKFAEPK